jgi:hypothetical protein
MVQKEGEKGWLDGGNDAAAAVLQPSCNTPATL